MARLPYLAAYSLQGVQHSSSALAQQPRARGAVIRLRAATFTPSLGERPAIPGHLTRANPVGRQSAYYLVQFGGAVRQEWKDALSATGAAVLGYVPDNAFKVRMLD